MSDIEFCQGYTFIEAFADFLLLRKRIRWPLFFQNQSCILQTGGGIWESYELVEHIKSNFYTCIEMRDRTHAYLILEESTENGDRK